MKYGRLNGRSRTYTLERDDIEHDVVSKTENGTYIYNEYGARLSLMKDKVFQFDCAFSGFPVEMNVHESDTPDTFSIDVSWLF